MTGFCQDDCADLVLIGNPTAGCPTEKVRKRAPSRIGFFPCSTALPTTYTKAALEPLFTGPARDIVLTSKLANVQIEDPVMESILIHDCIAPVNDIISRRLTAEDRIAVQVPIAEGGVNKFGDFDFWKDKKKHYMRLFYMLVWCNGDVRIMRDEDDQLAAATLEAFTSYQKLSGNGGAVGSIEFTKIALNFVGDPFSFAVPDFNLNDLGINV